MKCYIVFLVLYLTVLSISLVHARPDNSINRPILRINKDLETKTEAPVTIRAIKMVPNDKMKIVEPEKTTQQPLASLYKFYVSKKPIMRKFKPQSSPSTERIAISRRPLMKHREYHIAVTTPKPRLDKKELFTTNRRRSLSPIGTRDFNSNPKDTGDDEDEFEMFASNDNIMFAGSRRVYRKIMGNLPKKFQAKPIKSVDESATKINTKLKENHETSAINQIKIEKLDNIVTKVNSTPIEEASSKTVSDIKSNDADEEADKVEFIFISSTTNAAPKFDNVGEILKIDDVPLQNFENTEIIELLS